MYILRWTVLLKLCNEQVFTAELEMQHQCVFLPSFWFSTMDRD